MPTFLPPIGGFTAGIVLAAVLQALKRGGMDVRWTRPVVVVVGTLWSLAAMVADVYPEYTSFVELAVVFVFMAATLFGGSELSYQWFFKELSKRFGAGR